MKPPKLATALSLVVGFGLIFPLLINLISKTYFPFDLKIESMFFHSALEIAGAVIAILSAGILIFKKQKMPSYLWVVCAFISMGVLDSFHASIKPSNNFVWLHSLSVLFGGLFFSLLWCPIFKKQQNDKFLFRIVAFITFLIMSAIGFLSLIYSNVIPNMLFNGSFSSTANLLNYIGGILFLIGSFYFINEYAESINTLFFALAILCAIFGASGILFQFSSLWGISWWMWHILRLIAYLFGIIVIYNLKEITQKNIKGEKRK